MVRTLHAGPCPLSPVFGCVFSRPQLQVLESFSLTLSRVCSGCFAGCTASCTDVFSLFMTPLSHALGSGSRRAAVSGFKSRFRLTLLIKGCRSWTLFGDCPSPHLNSVTAAHHNAEVHSEMTVLVLALVPIIHPLLEVFVVVALAASAACRCCCCCCYFVLFMPGLFRRQVPGKLLSLYQTPC